MVNPIGNILVGGLVVEDEVKGSRSPFSSNKKKKIVPPVFSPFLFHS